MKKTIKNISFFANAGIGEFGTKQASVLFKNKQYQCKTVIANELLAERAHLYSLNYPDTDMVVGSITDKKVMEKIISKALHEKPISATISPPCQGSSGLNAFKNQKYDFRNQLIKSFFYFMKKYEGLEFGYIENVLNYYKATIPGLYKGKLITDFIEDEKGYIHSDYILLSKTKDDGFAELKTKIKGFKYYKTASTDDPQYESIHPISLLEFITRQLSELGYKTHYSVIRGDEYGAPQVRQRGFVFFFKEKYNFEKIKPVFKTCKEEAYDGNTVLDAFIAKGLINTPSEGIYEDNTISFSEFSETFKTKQNFHYSPILNERYKHWLQYTKEGNSCYRNEKEQHRPYKIIEVTAAGSKNNYDFVLKADKPEWKKLGVLDFRDYMTEAEKKLEPDFINGRNWRIESSSYKGILEKRMAMDAQKKIKNREGDKFFILLPIKGFEQATYKRAFLNMPSSALTTKMGVGNSNTVHPKFNRTWSPAEVMAIFGLGLKLNSKNRLVGTENYKIPNTLKPKEAEVLIYEICGEGIISIVGQKTMEYLISQWLNNTA